MSVVIVDYPIILLNLKTYEQSMGQKAIDFARIAERVYEKTGISIAVAPQILDIAAVTVSSETPVFSQHIDPVYYGKYTGHVLPEAVAEAGAIGTLLNHSECQIPLEQIEESIKRAREVDLIPVVCVDTVETAKRVALLNPDAIAIEPPELIGSGISVSTAQPEIVSGAVEAVHTINPDVKVLCGAGITNGEDASAALDLGAKGILVASGVVKAEDPYKALLELARAMQR
ncbi:MAG TPA: triose-phosphate isomerase [Candidatus Bathyarchaeota archaeon]|nr:triose-phosphate isomerase [Candidatus Bathyarchaeota archaeon]